MNIENVRINYESGQYKLADLRPSGEVECELSNEHGGLFTAGVTVSGVLHALQEAARDTSLEGKLESISLTMATNIQMRLVPYKGKLLLNDCAILTYDELAAIILMNAPLEAVAA